MTDTHMCAHIRIIVIIPVSLDAHTFHAWAGPTALVLHMCVVHTRCRYALSLQPGAATSRRCSTGRTAVPRRTAAATGYHPQPTHQPLRT